MKMICLILIFVSLTAWSQSFAEDQEPKKELREKLQAIAKKHQQKGEKVVVIGVPEADMSGIFPDKSTKRVKIDSKVIITDGENVFTGKISPGGQSTLTAETPNLRVKKLKQKIGEGDALVGIQNIDGTTRINPLTMDESYISTNFYQRALNHFELVPEQRQLEAKFAKVIYVPFTEAFEVQENKAVQAGMHLVNNHPVKLLENAQTDTSWVKAVGRSRYNVSNIQEKLKLAKPDADTQTFTSMKSATSGEKTTPYRVELRWSSGDEATKQLQTMLHDLYAAPLKYKGSELYSELSKLMDTEQMFRFLALNQIFKNGDISDEYFWYLQEDKKMGQFKLRIMPQDGDDLLKGSHLFPFNRQQIGLIVRDKLGISKDFIFNYEDPLFRTIKNDPFLYHEYLKTYQKVATDIANGSFLDKELTAIENELKPYSNDPHVLQRGATDEVGRVYEPDSFSKRAAVLKKEIKKNAKTSLEILEKEELPKVLKNLTKPRNSCLKFFFWR